MNWFGLTEYILWWVFFGIVHSVTANHQFKSWFPIKGVAYRILYNIISTTTLMIILFHQPSISKYVINGFDLHIPKKIAFFLLFIIGGGITTLGLLQWDLLNFLGLSSEEHDLDTHGMFAFARHPVYTGLIILFTIPTLYGISPETCAWLFGAGGYFIIGTYFEERNLSYYFPNYKEYSKNVGRFFPWRRRHFQYILTEVTEGDK